MEQGYNDYNKKEYAAFQLARFPLKALLRELVRRFVSCLGSLIGLSYDKTGKIIYNGITVFDSPLLDGGGASFGQDYIRCLLVSGLKRCERIYEFCSGPGYIGYSLFANGFCEKLTLSDIKPEAVRMARLTASHNHIEHLVNIYLSDCLDKIPENERWDLVVGNPPHYLPPDASCIARDDRESPELSGHEARIQARNRNTYDPDWAIHKRFYGAVKKFMKPGGFIVLQENCETSRVDIFKTMIETGGGRLVKTLLGQRLSGKRNNMYYIISQW